MALDKNTLKSDLVTALNTAKDQSWTVDQVAGAIADAVDRYTRGAAVTGVVVTVGSAQYPQTANGKLT
jgi:hypothetical protein